MRADRWTDECEQGCDGSPVDRAEVDRMLQEAECHRRLHHVKYDWIANMGYRDPIPDARRAQALAGEQDLIEKLAIDLFGQVYDVDHGAQHGRFVDAAHTVRNTAGLERLG